MKALSLDCVTGWVNQQNWWVPRSIDTVCPFCQKSVNLGFEKDSIFWDPLRRTMAATAHCPGCGQSVSIWTIDPGPANDSSKKGCSCVAIFPANQEKHQLIEGAEHIPEPIRKCYGEAVQVFNAGVWPATLTLCRRTLEGAVLQMTSQTNRNQTLADALRDLPNKVDLGKPITSLADSVRLGGNIGAHFDSDIDPDLEMAKTMLNLLEYLLEYFYTIPKLIEDAKAVLDKPKP